MRASVRPKDLARRSSGLRHRGEVPAGELGLELDDLGDLAQEPGVDVRDLGDLLRRPPLAQRGEDGEQALPVGRRRAAAAAAPGRTSAARARPGCRRAPAPRAPSSAPP